MNWVQSIFRDYYPRKIRKIERRAIEALPLFGQFYFSPCIDEEMINPEKSGLFLRLNEEIYELKGEKTKEALKEMFNNPKFVKEIKRKIGIK